MAHKFRVRMVLITGKRPELAKRLIEILAKIKPGRILVVSGGPRPNVPGNVERCAAVRSLFDYLNWECRVHRDFAESIMGSFAGNSTGLDFALEKVEEAILLEADCMPDLSFFSYCEKLLCKYDNETSVSLITGNNFLNKAVGKNSDSYFFSSIATTWNWASWRRIWKQVDLNVPYWSKYRDSSGFRQAVFSVAEERYWQSIYNAIGAWRIKSA